MQFQDYALQLWDPEDADPGDPDIYPVEPEPWDLIQYRQLYSAMWHAIQSFAGQHHSREDTTLSATSDWMCTLSATLGLLCTLARSAAERNAPLFILSRAHEGAGTWAMRVAGAILDVLCGLGDRAAEAGLQLPGQAGTTSLPLHAAECANAGLALLEVASLWDDLLKFLGPLGQAVAAHHGWLGRRQRYESASFHIWSGLSCTQLAELDGVCELERRLAAVQECCSERGTDGLALLLPSLFR